VPTEPALGYAIVALVAAQRLAEVVVDAANTRRLEARGGVLVRDDGFRAMFVFHALWFVALVAERHFLDARVPSANVALPLVGALAVVESVRAWVLATLGRRFTIRVVVVPGERPIADGPYRLVRHPNYLVVAAELLIVPLWVGCWRTAIVGSLAHVPVIWNRIRREEAAWARIGDARC
jgi:methyltransferase